LELIPERWLEGERCLEEHRGDERKAFQAFSVGPTNCIGKNLAYMEMRLILARVLWEFDMEMVQGEERGGNWRERVKAFGFLVKPDLMFRLVL
jgi:cytochrome P450